MVSLTKRNTPTRIALGQDGSWLPEIVPAVAQMGGAQTCAALLDPFARARRNSVPE